MVVPTEAPTWLLAAVLAGAEMPPNSPTRASFAPRAVTVSAMGVGGRLRCAANDCMMVACARCGCARLVVLDVQKSHEAPVLISTHKHKAKIHRVTLCDA